MAHHAADSGCWRGEVVKWRVREESANFPPVIPVVCECLITNVYHFYNQKKCFELLNFSVTVLKETFKGKYFPISCPHTYIVSCYVLVTMVFKQFHLITRSRSSSVLLHSQCNGL